MAQSQAFFAAVALWPIRRAPAKVRVGSITCGSSIDSGELSAAELRGAGHGELGQTQFLPSSYVRFAVDFDGNGKKDLIRSQADVLASTANYLRGYGWRPGGGWEEGSANFAALAGWNKSSNYQRAIALFASKVSGGGS